MKMGNKILLKILALACALVMVISCATPCIAVDNNSTNNTQNSGISLENTSVNVSVTGLYHSPGNINSFNILKEGVDENYNSFRAFTFSPHYDLYC